MKILGLEIGDLPEGYQPIEVVMMVKCLVPDSGNSDTFGTQWSMRASEGLHIVEALGAVQAVSADLKNDYINLVNGKADD